jgi:hypothetical protein
MKVWHQNLGMARGWLLCGCVALVALCAQSCAQGAVMPLAESDAGARDAGVSEKPSVGALVRVGFKSKVGVLLDEIPDSIRERVAAKILAQDRSVWVERAKRQLALASYRLNFRPSFYEDEDQKSQLPLPPPELFDISLGKAERAQVGEHDYVLVDYTLDAMLLTDVDSPKRSEPALAKVGGTWDEPFIFPIDPELLLQRTGYACMDEAEFPPNSVDSEDVEFFYDQTCEVEPELTKDGCHYTSLAQQSCVEALDARVGKIEAPMHYERIAWDPKKADAARVGEVSNPNGSDLKVLHDELLVNRLTYRYVSADSCAIAENCVGGKGFRRLLQFNASEQNTGSAPLEIGNVDYFLDMPDDPTPNANHHIYEYSECHMHYHFSHYATFAFGGSTDLGSKRAFCLESVARYSNNEHSPTWSPYSSCHFQGISQGWADQYNAGIECQWVDVTSIDTSNGPVSKPLDVTSNPDGFLCEGQPVLDKKGEIVWQSTAFETDAGEPVDRPKCDFMDGWDANNATTVGVTLPPPGEGMLTSPCTRGQIGKLRNCGFSYDHEVRACKAGKKFSLSCSLAEGSAPQVVRICEASAVLGAGVACSDADALATQELVDANAVAFDVPCPGARDDDEPGGSYALYTAPSFPGDAAAEVTCTAD